MISAFFKPTSIIENRNGTALRDLLILWRRSRHELWPSILLTFVATLIFRGHVPLGPRDTIGYPSALLVAWLLALDAILDWPRMGMLHRCVAALWFILLSLLTPLVLYESFTTRLWADR